jgi:hypothetical protein
LVGNVKTFLPDEVGARTNPQAPTVKCCPKTP